jgi:hypothetical protein
LRWAKTAGKPLKKLLQVFKQINPANKAGLQEV